VHYTLCEHREFVKPAPHISRLGVYKYPGRAGKCQHKDSSFNTESVLLRVFLSVWGFILSVLPERRTSSTAAGLLSGSETSTKEGLSLLSEIALVELSF
jgi:hypothetical protein